MCLQAASWHTARRLRQTVEADPAALRRVRAVLDPLEDGLWTAAEELDAAGADDADWVAWSSSAVADVDRATTACLVEVGSQP